ncbi:hypothetical protein DQ384_19840 [Sphaerisporangium album]|uniref:Uncharacterized protein n=1 Tax=Sphaerisporangium album TaxID=509200 RepID=A0A367FHG8_9ACTN|nr:hypothetical protein [Sphaerisporangium album]RCG29818.1 hypothetical protein DQ384_19840 [Sphaerisporangium album]
MRKRTRLVVVTATLAALAATGTAAAASGPTPAPSPVTSDSAPVKADENIKKSAGVEGKARASADADLAAIAAKLGVTTDRLTAALVATKRSLVNATDVTPDAIVAAVAANLGLPVAQVQDALAPLINAPKPDGDARDEKRADGPRKRDEKSGDSPDAHLAPIAAELGVTAERLTDAMRAAKTSLARSADITPETIVAAIAANLGLPVAQVQEVLGAQIGKPGPSADGKDKVDIKDKQGVEAPQD